MGNPTEARRCSERRRDGEPCRGRPVLGGTACPSHGGRKDPTIETDPEGTAARLLAAAGAAAENAASAFLAAAGEWE